MTPDTPNPSEAWKQIVMERISITSGCWPWIGSVQGGGYGIIQRHRKNILAHRAVYELLVGKIPDGLTLDHLCRNRICVNPAHLEPVTNRENRMRGYSPPAIYARRTHCSKGHDYTPHNTRIAPKGFRICLTCERARGIYSRTRRRKVNI